MHIKFTHILYSHDCEKIYTYIIYILESLLLNNILRVIFLNFNSFSVIYKLLASTSEGIRVQALKAMGYFLKHLAPKWVYMTCKMKWSMLFILQILGVVFVFCVSCSLSLFLFIKRYINLILLLHVENKVGAGVCCLSSMKII